MKKIYYMPNGGKCKKLMIVAIGDLQLENEEIFNSNRWNRSVAVLT